MPGLDEATLRALDISASEGDDSNDRKLFSSDSFLETTFEKPTASSGLPKYTNLHQDKVKAAFDPQNYQLIRELGRDPSDAQISHPQTRLEHENVQNLFQAFLYTPEKYDRASEQRQLEKSIHLEKLKTLGHNSDWKYSRAAKDTSREKVWAEDYTPPQSNITRKFTYDPAAAPFLPPGIGLAKEKVSRMNLQQLISDLKSTISEDWPSNDISVVVDTDDLIVIKFPENTTDSEYGLLAYMNMLIACNEIALQFQLSKCVEAWHVRANKSIFFALQPPWVATKSSAAFFALHPEQESFQDTAHLEESKKRHRAKYSMF